MRGHKVFQSVLLAILVASATSCSAVIAHDEEIVVSKSREIMSPSRAVDAADICSEGEGRYRLTLSNYEASNHYFQLDNFSDASLFIYLMRDGDKYWTNYPSGDVLFRTTEGGSWEAPVIGPGSFIQSGVERVSVEPKSSVVFRFPVAEFLPPSVNSVKLQVRFDTVPHGTGSGVCVSSAPFSLPLPD